MSYLVSISGCKAVGKTTLVRGLQSTIPNLVTREGFRRTELGYDVTTEQGFYANERWYFEREIREYQAFKRSGHPVVLLRGPEELLFYAMAYPALIGKPWDVRVHLADEVHRLRACRSDRILYLDARYETIWARKTADATKPRYNMQRWMDDWEPRISTYTKRLPQTVVLDTTQMTKEEVLAWTLHWLGSLEASSVAT